ncbi:slipin family protein [Pseudonocardia sp.]|uniref:slipin family protein n=1 Tax=Pseudonocardia sp. TaxID=60912 RepID=UPI0026272530|nr:slipin family protein [Pseudonocardia sp.]
MTPALVVVALIAALLLAVVGAGVRLVQQYQRGVVLRFGRLLPEIREPGLRVIIPFVDQMTKVPVQTVVMDIPAQGAITKDNVTLSVDAVVYFRVTDPAKAVVNVENYLGAVSQVAQTSLRSVIGRADLDTMLSDREQVNAELRAVIDTPTEEWGVSVDRVEIKDIALPEGMRRSMSRQAEAERDRRARVIAADGEFQASAKLADAAQAMGETPGALQLRLLQTVSDVASDKNSTLVMPFPIELLRFFENATGGSAPVSTGAEKSVETAPDDPPAADPAQLPPAAPAAQDPVVPPVTTDRAADRP